VVNTLTMHPNPYVRSRPELPWPPPSCDEDKRHTRLIAQKVWLLDDFKKLAMSCLEGNRNAILAVTHDCSSDMQDAMLTYEDVAEIVNLLTDDDYHNSLWCMRSMREGVRCAPEALWLPCDSYVIETEFENDSIASIKYYLKMCKSPMGTVLLMISIHPSEYDH
jgi:hypothetical protein